MIKSDIEARLAILAPILLPISLLPPLLLPMGFDAGRPDSFSDYLLVVGPIGGPIGLVATRHFVEQSVISMGQRWLGAALAAFILPMLLVIIAISLQ